jgi:hypothetical protein
MTGNQLGHFLAMVQKLMAMCIIVIGQLYPVQYKGIFGTPNQGQMLHV